MKIGNLFAGIEPPEKGERFESLLTYKNLSVERIVSSEAIIPMEYIQSQDEWVALIQGRARIKVADETVTLNSGDYLFLPAGVPHIVKQVSHGAIWLAVHLHPRQTEPPDGEV